MRDLPPTEQDREPAFDLALDDPGDYWTRLRCGLSSEPLEHTVTYPDLLIVLLAEAIVAAEEYRWFDSF